MVRKKTCNHQTFKSGCASCRALKRHWYGRLKEIGFVDIEYGQESPRYTKHQADPGQPGVQQAKVFYENAWAVYHAWIEIGRSKRDCRVAELFAAQQGDTGTVRGISRVLKYEGLRPRSTRMVQKTLSELKALIITQAESGSIETKENDDKTVVYLDRYHRAA